MTLIEAMEPRIQSRTNPGLPGVYLHPGQISVSQTPCTVTTILGSCVAVGLWDAREGVGGLCHFLLPEGTRTQAPSPRFAEAAVAQLVSALAALGARPEALFAKIFGGACVIEAMRKGHLGVRNVERARALLAERGIPIVGADVEGNRGRKLIFHTADGSAWVKLLTGGPSWS
jgi:chemotaxis protein CheD